MTSTFHHIALIGKYHTPAAGVPSDAASEALQRIAGYVRSLGCEVILDTQSAIYAGLPDYPSMDVDGLGRHCDLGLVVGGDGTMLGVCRHLARYGTPLVGINQGRLGLSPISPWMNSKPPSRPYCRASTRKTNAP
jgi:NAD+ kinase